jgi:predicted nucleotidyltransferase
MSFNNYGIKSPFYKLFIVTIGSYVRGEEKPESDIDVLVEFYETKGLLILVRIERELSEFLGVKVDLLTEE